jgi:WD40 repeat protein
VATLHRVAQQHTQRALHFMENGDAFRGLLPLAEAIDIGSGDAAADRMNRMRFAGILRMSPQLQGLWLLPKDTPAHAQFPTAGHAVLLTDGRAARLGDGPALEHRAHITGADLNDDGSRVLCGTADGSWALWDGHGGRRIASGPGSVREFPPLTACHTDATIAGGRFVVVEGKVVRQFHAADGTPAAPDMIHEHPVRWAAISPDARKLFTFTSNGVLLTASADQPDSRARPGKTDADLVFHSISKMPDQGYHTVCDRAGQTYGLIGWDYSHPQIVDPKHDPMMFPVPAPLLAIGWSVGGQSHFLTGGKLGATLRSPWVYIDPDKYQLGTTFPQSTRTVAASFDGSGHTAVTLAVNGASQMWDVPVEGRMGPRLWSIGKPLDARLSRDGKAVLVRTSAAAVWLWNWPARDGAEKAFTAAEWAASQDSASFPAPRDAASTVLPDGRRVAATIVDAQSVVVADAATGLSISPPVIHPEPVNAVSLSPDGQLLCTVWGGRYARVWETSTGQPVTPQFQHTDLTGLAWHRDSQSLATTGKSGEVRVWNLSPAQHDTATLKTLARLLSAHRLLPGSESGLIPLSAAELGAAWEAGKSR